MEQAEEEPLGVSDLDGRLLLRRLLPPHLLPPRLHLLRPRGPGRGPSNTKGRCGVEIAVVPKPPLEPRRSRTASRGKPLPRSVMERIITPPVTWGSSPMLLTSHCGERLIETHRFSTPDLLPNSMVCLRGPWSDCSRPTAWLRAAVSSLGV